MQKQLNQTDIVTNKSQGLKSDNYQHQQFKNPATTKFTQNTHYLEIGQSVVLGKNDMLQATTQWQINSQAESSDISFVERLDLNHQQSLSECLNKFIDQKVIQSQKAHITHNSDQKAFQLIKDIESKVMEEIKIKFGNFQVQKIKYTLSYLKRNEELARLYFRIIKSISVPYRLCSYQLFKQSLLFCFKARERIKNQNSSINEQMIEQYVKENYQSLCQLIMKDEKLIDLCYSLNDQKCKFKFKKFVLDWIQGFFLCKQGYPSRKSKKIGKHKLRKNRQYDNEQQKQGKKRLKKL